MDSAGPSRALRLLAGASAQCERRLSLSKRHSKLPPLTFRAHFPVLANSFPINYLPAIPAPGHEVHPPCPTARLPPTSPVPHSFLLLSKATGPEQCRQRQIFVSPSISTIGRDWPRETHPPSRRVARSEA